MLHFNGLEPVDFKGKKCTPKVDQEKKLRLSMLKFESASDIKEADEVLGSCFDEKYAKDFIAEKLSAQDKQVLATYLTGGETGLNRLSKATDGAIEKYITRAMEGLDNE